MKRSVLVFLAAAGAGAAAVVAAPYRTITPGKVAPGHARLRDDCFACHTPFSGPASARCARCHRPEQIGVRTVAGGARTAPPPRPFVPGLHRALAAADCQRCHLEHGGRVRTGAGLRFTHDVVPAGTRADCVACHAAQRPKDVLHVRTPTACSACHGTERWKPARYDHDRLFRFDGNHPPRCADCHTVADDLRRYDCTGCHEHSRARMVAEHREVRVRDLDACARCHRSGNEHERVGGEGGGSRRGEGEGEREGEDDDD